MDCPSLGLERSLDLPRRSVLRYAQNFVVSLSHRVAAPPLTRFPSVALAQNAKGSCLLLTVTQNLSGVGARHHAPFEQITPVFYLSCSANHIYLDTTCLYVVLSSVLPQNISGSDSIQPSCFPSFTHSRTQRRIRIRFAINDLRFLPVATHGAEGSGLIPTWLPPPRPFHPHPSFSTSYKLLFDQTFWNDTHTNAPGVWVLSALPPQRQPRPSSRPSSLPRSLPRCFVVSSLRFVITPAFRFRRGSPSSACPIKDTAHVPGLRPGNPEPSQPSYNQQLTRYLTPSAKFPLRRFDCIPRTVVVLAASARSVRPSRVDGRTLFSLRE
jgi:hypothetical protein